MLAGLFLQFGESQGCSHRLGGLPGLFLARIGSTICLANQSDAEPGLVERIDGLSPSGSGATSPIEGHASFFSTCSPIS